MNDLLFPAKVLCASMYASLCREGLDNSEAVVKTMMLNDLESALDKNRNTAKDSKAKGSFWTKVFSSEPSTPPPVPSSSSPVLNSSVTVSEDK